MTRMHNARIGKMKGLIMSDVKVLEEQVGCNEAASEAQIKICNLKLKQNNLPELPTEYAAMLKIHNGFSNEDAKIFGAEIKDNNWYKDIAGFNIGYFHGNQSDWLILGESDFLLFIYDSSQKKYFITDRDDLEEEYSETDFMTALYYLLRIE